MGVKELIEKQEATGHIFLIRQGLFLRGYNSGALMLEALLGYKAQRMYLKICKGEVCAAGFPSSNLDRVIAEVKRQGGMIVDQTEGLVEISGLDYPCTQEVIRQHREKERFVPAAFPEKHCREPDIPVLEALPYEKIVAQRVLSYNLSDSTPLEALLFLNSIQKEFGGNRRN